MADLCQKDGCKALGAKHCGACGRVSYCSADCQKEDWKVHKVSCLDVKKLPMNFVEPIQMSKYMLKVYALNRFLKSKGKPNDAHALLQEYLVFVEHQYGKKMEGTALYKRSNGSYVDNTVVVDLRVMISTLRFDYRLEDIDLQLAYAIESRRMLHSRNQSEKSSLLLLGDTERCLYLCYSYKKMGVEAEYHARQSLMFARLLIEGNKTRITLEFHALRMLAHLRVIESRLLESIEYAEEAYIVVSGKYGPVHPDVQVASTLLIDCLIANKDYSRADDYCRIDYESLMSPQNGMDDDREIVALAMGKPAHIWSMKPPVDDERAAFALAEEAEELSRKAWQMMRAKSSCVIMLDNHAHIFSEVLMKRGKYTDEARTVLEYSLDLCRRNPEFRLDVLHHRLNRMAHFHHHLSEAMSFGSERDRELKLRHEYTMESNLCE